MKKAEKKLIPSALYCYDLMILVISLRSFLCLYGLPFREIANPNDTSIDRTIFLNNKCVPNNAIAID
uniref:Uncharacterized protein n=1 Tax=Podoviridae sp. ctZkC8 TaxID=2825259 RepID=A0A8S5UBK1_9CAUD|nr:MAG TPA: hypothetical protein [Podoviridae sp. ctZkC8]